MFKELSTSKVTGQTTIKFKFCSDKLTVKPCNKHLQCNFDSVKSNICFLCGVTTSEAADDGSY